MDLIKSGKLLCDLRKSKGMTQKEVAERLKVLPKTVSKWETGHGFPDVTKISDLADVLGVSERVLLYGSLVQNTKSSANIKKTKFYVCPWCGSVMQGVGESRVVCCGKPVEPLSVKQTDDEHLICVSEIEDDFYIEIEHEMTKEHYIRFVAYAGVDRILMVHLYPEQDASVRFAKMHGGRFYYCCSKHGLFEYRK